MSADPVTDPVTEPVARPTADPVAVSVAEPVADPFEDLAERRRHLEVLWLRGNELNAEQQAELLELRNAVRLMCYKRDTKNSLIKVMQVQQIQNGPDGKKYMDDCIAELERLRIICADKPPAPVSTLIPFPPGLNEWEIQLLAPMVSRSDYSLDYSESENEFIIDSLMDDARETHLLISATFDENPDSARRLARLIPTTEYAKATPIAHAATKLPPDEIYTSVPANPDWIISDAFGHVIRMMRSVLVLTAQAAASMYARTDRIAMHIIDADRHYLVRDFSAYLRISLGLICDGLPREIVRRIIKNPPCAAPSSLDYILLRLNQNLPDLNKILKRELTLLECIKHTCGRWYNISKNEKLKKLLDGM